MAADKITSELIEFYGTECIHCSNMQPTIDRLADEEGLKVQKIEMWHNTDNESLFQEMDQGRCGGVPFFLNTKTNKFICGKTSYEKLVAWAKGE